MSKSIEQLRALAAQIEEAYRQGENTQVRVGGLFMDIIDFMSTIPAMQTVLGPLLQALNNSDLINPSDGQTLTFSLMKDGWTFSDALTQLQIKLGQISSTVTSNYNAFLQTKDLLQREIDSTDERVRGYKTEYDQSQIEYATWKSQTDTSIAQYAVAIDKNTGDIISISGRVDTAYDQLDFVTNNLEASDKALNNLLDLTGLQYEDPEGSYTSSWLYKNRQGIYGAAATFDDQGNIIQSSVLGVTVNGVESRVSNAEGKVSLISQTVDQISSRVTNAEGNISSITQTVNSISSVVAADENKIKTLQDAVNGTAGNPGILARLGATESKSDQSASWINQHRNKIELVVGEFDSTGKLTNTAGLVTTSTFSGLFAESFDNTGTSQALAQMNVEIDKKVNEDGVEEIISKANIKGDQIDFTFTETATFSSGGSDVMVIDSNGNLYLKGYLMEGSLVGGNTHIQNDGISIGYTGHTVTITAGVVSILNQSGTALFIADGGASIKGNSVFYDSVRFKGSLIMESGFIMQSSAFFDETVSFTGEANFRGEIFMPDLPVQPKDKGTFGKIYRDGSGFLKLGGI